METLRKNSYWQCFFGFNSFQRGQILDAATLVKFRNRTGTDGMKQIESFSLKTWSDMGLVKTKRVAVDTTAQPKNIAYPTDADLLHRIREKITGQVKRVNKEVALLKPFRTYSRSGKKQLLKIKKFHRKEAEERQRVKIEPVIGHLKSDHRINRCRYKGAKGDTVNVVWATLAWNTKKITHLHRQKEAKRAQREMKRAA